MRRFQTAVLRICVTFGIAISVAGLTGANLASPAQAQNLEAALAASAEKNWVAARRHAGAPGSVLGDIVEWQRLRAGEGDPSAYLEFVARRGDWPGMDYLRRQGEEVMAATAPSEIMQYYATTSPQTAEGALSLAEALIRAGRKTEGEGELVRAWRSMAMSQATEARYLPRYARLLAPHHEARLNQLLWDGHTVSGGRMLDRVSAGARALGAARIALQEDKRGVDDLIAAIPRAQQGDPGLAYDRFAWRDRKRRQDDAIALMAERSTSAETLGKPGKWLRRRRDFARQLMRDDAYQRAYNLAANHHATPEDGYGFADAEWIAGYIALRKLNKPETAAYHFTRFLSAVETPISLGRAGYWLGRAYTEMGEVDKAHAAYMLGANFQTSFYGLLAAEALGRPFSPALVTPPETAWENAEFLQNSVAAAGLALIKAGDLDLAERFLTHLAESLSPDEALALGQMAVGIDQPHLAVMISKRAARQGQELAGAYYPLHPVADLDLPMAKEMTLAIARRESEFDHDVISHAGARGLMQVMPATGQKVARDIGASAGHSSARMLADWPYNAKLGAAYLEQLAEQFDGNVVLMAAGYNAGPHRSVQWMERYGDPRRRRVDIIDWIEHIPFNETRNYVMRVTESLPIYRARLGKTPLPQPFSRELAGDSLK